MNEPVLTFVLPYYNEAGYIGATLATLAAQSDRRFALILVDNASSDGSAQFARVACEAMPDIRCEFLFAAEPGKIFALVMGCGAVQTELLATIDADTFYPPDYVSTAIAVFDGRPDAVCAIAHQMDSQGRASRYQRLMAALFPKKAHSGGFAEIFRTAALRQCGGFDPGHWPYVLEDHEIVHRITRFGSIAYRPDLRCRPSDRRSDRSGCSWTPGERILYKLLPSSLMNWFFYRFLAARLERRGQSNIALRAQPWQAGAT